MQQLVETSKRSSSYDATKFNLPKFDGEPINYLPFMLAFESRVLPVVSDPAARLSILTKHMSDEAMSLIKCCVFKPPAEGYQLAIELLKDTYGGSDDVCWAWENKFKEMSPVEGHKGLRMLSSAIRCCKETLKTVGQLTAFQHKENILKIVENRT